MADIGPLPSGRYYLVDRQSGGHLGYLKDFFLEHIYGTDRGKWFALYRDDEVIDDFTFIQGGQAEQLPSAPDRAARIERGVYHAVQSDKFRRAAEGSAFNQAHECSRIGRTVLWNGGRKMRTVLNLAAAAVLWFGFAVALGHVSFTPGMTAGLVHLSSYFGFNGDEAVEDFFMISSAAVALLLAVGGVWLGSRAIRRRMTTA